MKTRKLLVSAVCLVVLAGAALAQEHGLARKVLPKVGLVEHLAQELDLTAEQKATAVQLQGELQSRAAPLHEQLAQHWNELNALLDSANPDAAELGQRLIATHALEGQMRALHLEYRTKLGAVLSPEQKAKLDRMNARGERERMVHFE